MKFLKALPALLGLALAAPTPAKVEDRSLSVSVGIESGTVVGTSVFGVDTFNGIPYADSPVGSLRFAPPQKLSRNLGVFNTPIIAPACPQLLISSSSKNIILKLLNGVLQLPFLQTITGQEDCLNLNVQRPASTKAGDKLPVAVWIFGGGFELGATSTYNGASLIQDAVGQGQPFILVAMNYRVAGFGFMPGAEILKDGGANAGLLDQRLALEWVADNIEAFGGDPEKVTLWGESAGAISIFDQMCLFGGNATYKGNDLFRGAIMNSGSAVPAEAIDSPKAQAVYDNVAKQAGCSGAADTLDCLRKAPYNKVLQAINSVPSIFSYNSVALPYLPRPDGKVLTDTPDNLVEKGIYHAVPMIIGDQEDEGTLFSLFQNNITTTKATVDYLHSLFFHQATTEQLTGLVNTYDAAISSGSPFRTGILNELYPGFKRLAAILGDLVFTLTRRLVLSAAVAANPDVPVWSYLSSYDHTTPILGTFHASDILQVFNGILPNHASSTTRTYFFNFINNLDPNVGVDRYDNWPNWSDSQQLMWFKDALSNDILKDDFRDDSYQWIAQNRDSLRV